MVFARHIDVVSVCGFTAVSSTTPPQLHRSVGDRDRLAFGRR
jgi:hypothetical protein